ncbi:MAG: glycosyltransferase [Dinghuibacter sp.]|nr:glycosyltransferase [Dinghuibacter sp.]
MNRFPVISIITVCFNEREHIEQTINSVLNQTLAGIEFIVIDGASTDGTTEIIERYRNRIAYYSSEKDKGIYDGMNKGLKQATGEYILFLNGGDVLAANDVLEKTFATQTGADAWYGEVQFLDEQGQVLGTRSQVSNQQLPAQLNWKSLRHGMVVSHQAFIVKRELAPYYDLQYRICSDINWMIACLKNCRTTCNTGLVIAQFRTGGTSAQHRKKAWKERYQILKTHYGFLPNLLNHAWIIVRYLFSRKKY